MTPTTHTSHSRPSGGERSLLVIATGWGPSFGGINAFSIDFCLALGKLLEGKARVVCLTTPVADPVKESAAALGVEILTLPSVGPTDVSRTAEAARDLLRRAGITRPDLIIGHDIFTGPVAIALRSLVATKAAVIHHMSYANYQAVKVDGQTARHKESEQRRLLMAADVVLAVGPLLKESAEILCQGPAHMIVPGLADIDPVEYRNNAFRAIAFGRMGGSDSRIKQGALAAAGYGRFVKEISDLNIRLQCRFNVFGLTHEEYVAEEQAIRDLVNESAGRMVNVMACPYTEDRQELFGALAQNEVAMMLSWHEGFGLVGWEAIAAGVPLIVSQATGLYALLKDDESTLGADCVNVVDVKGSSTEAANEEDIASVSRILLRIAMNFSSALSQARKLRGYLRSRYTWEQCARAALEACRWEGLKCDVDIDAVTLEPVEVLQSAVAQYGSTTSASRDVMRALEKTPYPVKISEEMSLYCRCLPRDITATKSFLLAAELVALFAVLTRINKPIPPDISLLQKAALYDGRVDPSVTTELRRRVLAEKAGEGMSGFPPSFGFDVLRATVEMAPASDEVSPFLALNVLWGYLRNCKLAYSVLCGAVPEELLTDVLTFFQALSRNHLVQAVSRRETVEPLTRAFLDGCAREAHDQSRLYHASSFVMRRRANELAQDGGAIMVQLEAFLRLSGSWSEVEHRAVLAESAFAAVRGKFQAAPHHDRLRRAVIDLRATDLARTVLQNWASPDPEDGWNLSPDQRASVLSALGCLDKNRRTEILRDPIGETKDCTPTELVALRDVGRELYRRTRGYSEDQSIYINHVMAYTTGEPVRNKYHGGHELPDLEMLNELEAAAGIRREQTDDFRREMMNYIGALAIDGRGFDLKAYAPKLESVILDMTISRSDGDETINYYEWYLWQKCRSLARTPDESRLPGWMNKIGSCVLESAKAIRVGRAVLLGADLVPCEALTYIVERAAHAALGLEAASEGAHRPDLSQEERDLLDRFLVIALSEVHGYHPCIAADILALTRQAITGPAVTLPFPLDQAGRYG